MILNGCRYVYFETQNFPISIASNDDLLELRDTQLGYFYSDLND
jgi:hypothetical protein